MGVSLTFWIDGASVKAINNLLDCTVPREGESVKLDGDQPRVVTGVSRHYHDGICNIDVYLGTYKYKS